MWAGSAGSCMDWPAAWASCGDLPPGELGAGEAASLCFYVVACDFQVLPGAQPPYVCWEVILPPLGLTSGASSPGCRGGVGAARQLSQELWGAHLPSSCDRQETEPCKALPTPSGLLLCPLGAQASLPAPTITPTWPKPVDLTPGCLDLGSCTSPSSQLVPTLRASWCDAVTSGTWKDPYLPPPSG